MQPQSTETIITLDELYKLNMCLYKKNYNNKWIYFILLVLILYSIIPNLDTFDVHTFIGSLIAITFILVLFRFINKRIMKKQVKNYFESNKQIQNQLIHYIFHEEYVHIQTNNSSAKLDYQKLYKIYETKENIYLMESNMSGHILIKKNCSPDLISFIKQLKH